MIKKAVHTKKKKPATVRQRAKASTPATTTRAKKPNPAAQALGRLGGLARKRNLSPERASEIGRHAHAVRYGKATVATPEAAK